MKYRLLAACLFLIGFGMLRAAAQVNPYKEGSPGVTGYRAEVTAEVMVQEDKLIRRSLPSRQSSELQPVQTRGQATACGHRLEEPREIHD